ncbi:hypothetical protein JCM10207_007481 [Rhodosporidiobolus poonsookiae]
MKLPDQTHRVQFPGVNGLFGWLSVDGKPLNICTVEMDGNRAIAYVEAEENKPFQVRFADMRDGPIEDDYAMRLFVDGLHCGNIVTLHDQKSLEYSKASASRFNTFTGYQQSKTAVRPFKFSAVAVTDDNASATTDSRVLEWLGAVHLEYQRITVLHTTTDFAPEPLDEDPVPETSKKAKMSTRTAFGEAKKVKPMSRLAFDDKDKDPLSIVEFRYRSHVHLQLERKIPFSPVPSSSSSSPLSSRSPSPVYSDHSAFEADRARLKAIDAEAAALRLKLAAHDSKKPLSRPLKRIKREQVDELERKKRRDKRKGKEPEVLDICESSSDSELEIYEAQ